MVGSICWTVESDRLDWLCNHFLCLNSFKCDRATFENYQFASDQSNFCINSFCLINVGPLSFVDFTKAKLWIVCLVISTLPLATIYFYLVSTVFQPAIKHFLVHPFKDVGGYSPKTAKGIATTFLSHLCDLTPTTCCCYSSHVATRSSPTGSFRFRLFDGDSLNAIRDLRLEIRFVTPSLTLL